MPVGSYGRPTSGFEAFVGGASEGLGGVSDFLRKRVEDQQKDKDRQRRIQNDVWDQDRKNIEAGIGTGAAPGQVAQQGSPSGGFDEDGGSAGGHWAPLQQGVRPDAVTQARQQVGGIRAAIGGILARFNAPADGEVTTHLMKTGPSSRETEIGMSEAGANSRNERSVSAGLESDRLRIEAQARENAIRNAAELRGQDLTHQDRQAEIGVQRNAAGRQSIAMELQGDRDYMTSLDREMDNIRSELASKQAIMQHADPKNGDIMRGYQTWAREQQARMGALRQERDGISTKMRGRSIGHSLAQSPAASHGGGNSF